MKIVFTAKGNNWDSQMDPRFGRAEMFLVYDDQSDTLEDISNKQTENMEHGVGPKTSKIMIELEANVVITGSGAGGNALEILKSTGIEFYTGAGDMTIKEAYESYKKGELKKV